MKDWMPVTTLKSMKPLGIFVWKLRKCSCVLELWRDHVNSYDKNFDSRIGFCHSGYSILARDAKLKLSSVGSPSI